MEKSVEVFAIILFGGIGLSHILQPKAWVKLYILRDIYFRQDPAPSLYDQPDL